MLVMRTSEDSADPLGELVSAQQTVGLDHFTLAVNPFGFDGVQPRTLLWQQATYDPNSGLASTVFDLAVMFPWMASRTVCCPQPRFSAICGTSSLLEEARSIWERRKVKVALERNPASSRLRSSFESVRTKIGGFMPPTVTHNPKSILDVRSEERRVG